jgi:hypothetical protein
MTRGLCLALALGLSSAAARGAEITGKYVEARTCDIWTGPCFANAEMNLGGKQAVLGWKVERGRLGGVNLDGLGVVAVVASSDTLGLPQTGPAKALVIVDSRADAAQRDALVRLARKQGGELLRNVVAVQAAPVELTLCDCKDGACAVLQAGDVARCETRCIDARHDKACGNETAFYPPLVADARVRPAVAVEHGYSGKGLGQTWKESDRRGAYVGTFEVRDADGRTAAARVGGR